MVSLWWSPWRRSTWRVQEVLVSWDSGTSQRGGQGNWTRIFFTWNYFDFRKQQHLQTSQPFHKWLLHEMVPLRNMTITITNDYNRGRPVWYLEHFRPRFRFPVWRRERESIVSSSIHGEGLIFQQYNIFKINDNLCVEGWYEESIFTEAHTVKSDEPVGRRDDLRDHRYLGDHCRDHDRD